MFWPGRGAKGWGMAGWIGVALLALANLVRSDNGVIQAVSAGLGIWVVGMSAYCLITRKQFAESLAEAVAVPGIMLGGYVAGGVRLMKSVFGGYLGWMGARGEGIKKTTGTSILTGLVLAVPLGGVLIYLLAGGDPVFGTFVRQFLSWGAIKEVPARVILSGIMFAGLAPVSMMVLKGQFESPMHRLLGRLNMQTEMTVVGAVVAAILTVFLVVQWPYVFVKVAAETDLSRFGVATYSEYVRRGFGELLVAAVLVYSLTRLGLVVWRADGRRNSLRVVQLVNLGLLMVFLLSVARRIWLYQAYHGLSLIRIYGAVFLVWIGGLVVFVAARHFWAKRWVWAEAGLTVVIVVVFGWSNPESYLAVRHPPTVNGRVDYVYLAGLSADGVEGWRQSLGYAEAVLNREWAQQPVIEREQRRQIAYSGWIVQILMGKYADLVPKYGGESDWARLQEAISRGRAVSTAQLVVAKSMNLPSLWPWKPWNADGGVFASGYEPWRLYYTEYGNGRRPMDRWDKVLVWNASEARAFEVMNGQNWPERLVALTNRFDLAFEKVLAQPEAERGYDWDIAVGPFLER